MTNDTQDSRHSNKIKAVEIPESEFDKLAQAVSACGGLKSKKTKKGMEFGIFLNGHLMAKSVPMQNGGRHCEKYF
jgi:hypothetical protein